MKNVTTSTHCKPYSRALIIACLLFAGITSVMAINTKTCTTTGNWSNASIWSPVGVPKDTDNIIINSGVTLTVDGDYICRDLDLGNATGSNATLKIITAGNSLRVNGDLDFNAQNKNNTFLIDAGPGDMNFAGTFSHWSTTGTNKFNISTGSISFTPAVTIDDAGNSIVFTGGGTVTFNSNFRDEQDNITFYTGCVLNFYGNYVVDGADVDWGNKGTANFYGTGTITDNDDIIMYHVNIMASAATTLAAGTATFTVNGNFTMNTGCTFNMNDNFDLLGNFTNNGGTVSAGAVTLTLKGTSQSIGGTATLNLPNLQIGKTAGTTDCFVTMSRSTNCNNLVLSTTNKNRLLSLNSGVTLAVSGNLTINQPTKNNRYSTLSVGQGTCTVAGNLVYTGTNSGLTRICKVDVTTGTFTLGGTITWMANNVVATEVLTVSSGTINLTSSVTMGTKSGTISVTSTGNLNFNGTSAPSLNFGGATGPVLGSSYGSTIKFAKGLTATTTALTFAVGSTQIFDGTATITPTAAITFGNFQINSTFTVTAAGNFSVKGDWTNNGTYAPATYTVSLNGGGTQVLTKTGGETFYGLTVTPYGTTIQMNNDITITNTLTFNGANINANGYTVQLGSGAGAALVYSVGQVYGGTFKRYWPVGAITSTSGSYYGLFPVGTYVDYRPVTINTTANTTGAGYVSVSHTDAISATNLNYTDNEGFILQQIADKHSDISYTGVTGGTYNLAVKMTDMGSQGSVSNLRMIWYESGTPGSAGTHVTTAGPLSAPTGYRNGLTLANLAHKWVLGTNDRTNTPMYIYVYSRKTGNWNDNSATGTWSYTPGGAGAACSCLPTSSGYAVIESGHTVTVTTTDTCKFLDVMNGGRVVVNALRTFNVNGSLDCYGTGNFTNNGTLKVANELLLSSATSPTVNGDVTAMYLTMPSGTNYTQSSGTLTVTGELALSGNLTMAALTTFTFTSANGHLSGNGGVFQGPSGGSFNMTNNKLIEPNTNITIGSSGTNTALALAANTTVNNIGRLTVYGNVTGANASTSIWINNATSSLSSTGSIMTTGILDVATAPNTVEYSGSGAQTITVPYTTYNILKAANSGTKTLAGDMMVDSSLVIGGSVIIDESTNVISGDGGITMTGTSELKLSRSTDDYVYPELNGTYSLTGGTVTLYQTGDSCQVHPATYYNLKLNGSTPYDLGAVTGITNNLDMTGSSTIADNPILNVGNTFTYGSSGTSQLWDSIAVNGMVLSTGTLISAGESINVYGSGGWSKASGATFTPSTGTVYFTGTSAQTLGGTSASQTFNSLCVNKSSGTATVGGSTTTLNVGGDMILNAGVFDKGTANAINMTGGNWSNNGGSFTPGSGTVTFNSTAVDQAIQGLGSSETFNNVTINKSGYTLAIGESIAGVNLNGTMTLTAGTLDAGTATAINVKGDWTAASGTTFTPASSQVTFNGTGAQAINGTLTAHTFYKMAVNKSNTLSVAGSATSLTATNNITLTAGTFDKGTATNIYAGGNWTNNGGTFTYGTGTVHFNGTAAQAINGSAASQTFYALTVNKATDTLSIGGSTATVTVNNALTFTSGILKTGTAKIATPTTGSVSGAGAGKYIYGNHEVYIPNSAAPSKTFYIGDATTYAPVTLAFVGTVSGSGSITASTAAGDDANISTSGIDAAKSVNRNWTLTNSSVGGFTSYSPVYTFVAGDVDGGATTANFEIRRYTGGTWYATTAGSRTATTTQATGETAFGKTQIGEKNTLAVSAHPGNVSQCHGYSTTFTSTSSSTPTPTVKWQRDPNTGSWTDITGVMDGSVYTNYTTTTLSISDVNGLNNYKYRAVFTNINGSVTSNQATLTATATPTITGTTPNSRCDAGSVALGATASAGTINWYAASTGGSSLATGTSYSPNPSSTTTYYVDATAGGCTTASRTAVTATITATPTITGTTPDSRCGTGTVNLAATASAGTINWYAASSGGPSLQTGGSYTTPSISSTTTYYVDATSGSCVTASRTAVTATVNSIPTITGTTPGSRCDNGTVNLAATASAGTINWYAASSGGSSLQTGGSYTTPTISSTTTYYVDATNGGCTTASRTSVTATVTATPTITGTTPASRCDAGTVNLAATASAGTINWYAASSGGSSLQAGGSYTTPSIGVTTTYYVDATNGGCITASRTAVTATVGSTPSATIAYQSCAGTNGETTIRISQTGGNSPFTYSNDGSSYSSEDTFHVANGSNQNYYVKDANNCVSSANNYTSTSVVPTQISSSVGNVTCNCASSGEGREVYLTDASGNLVAIINDRGHNLGTITATAYTRANAVLVANNQGGNSAAMSRSFVLDFTGTNLTPSVEVKFPYTDAEMSNLMAAAAATPDGADDIANAGDLGTTQYEGPGEDDTYDASTATMLVYHRQTGTGSVLNGKFVKVALSSNGEHWIHGNNHGTALPVKLVSFEANAKQAPRVVETKWTTAVEINNNYFTVERSGDGINFNEVGRVAGAGNSTAQLNYRFNDTKPLSGLSYYRLKQTDFDGQFTYSEIVSVNMKVETAIRMYPNPTNNQVFISLVNPGNDINITIYDLNGRALFSQAFDGESYKQEQAIGLQVKNMLAAGVYMVNISTNGNEVIEKLIIN